MDGDKSALTKNEALTFEKLKQKWKELSEEDIILDGLYLNCTRLVQEYFEKVLKIELNSNRVIEIGLKSALQLLADKDLRWAEKLFNNMSFDSNTKISQICFFTPYKELRDYLITVLSERKILNQYELKMVDYLKQLESIYTCRSITQAKQKLRIYRNWSEYIKETNKTKNENFNCKELVKLNTFSTLNPQIPFVCYGHFVLEWIREWNLDTRSKIIVDGLIANKDNHDQLKSIKSSLLWMYLLEHLNFNLIFNWVIYSYSSDTIENTIFSVKLNQELIDYAYNYLQNLLLHNYFADNLAQYQIFASCELNNFNRLVNRLSSSQTFYDYKKTNEFHLKFIEHSLKHYPIQFLWSYLDYYENDIKLDELKVIEYKEQSFKMLNAFKNLLNVESNLSSICLSNIEYNLNKSNLNIDYLYEKNDLSLIGLALSLYCDIPLSSNSSEKLVHLIDENPALRLLIDSKNAPEAVSLYALLQEHSKIDVTKFFNWQLKNKITLSNNETNNKAKLFNNSLLSFDNQEFVNQYAYKEDLDYGFFLKQGRPFFAYYIFIINQIRKYGKMHKTIMDEARIRTHVIAIQNYENDTIVSSCVIFSELINGNTFKIKLNVHLMKIILFDYYKKRGIDEKSASDKCTALLLDFLKNEIDAKRLLNILENALIALMVEKYDSKQMFTIEACSLWLPIMCFSKVYNLQYSIKYLNLCAESNQWLMYLIFAQLYQIPRSLVISNLEYFTDIGLKQHLDYALHNVITSSTSASIKTSIANDLKTKVDLTKKPKKRTKKQIDRRTRADSSDSSSETFEKDSGLIFDNNSVANDEETNGLNSIDFYELLINCQNSNDPVKQLQIEALKWYTPVLSVFATFYPQHEKISCLCTFLFASLKHDQYYDDSNTKHILFNLNDLKIAIQSVAMRGYLRTLLNSLKIFIPGTILELYVDFLYHIFVKKDVYQAENLHSFYKYELIKVTLSKHQSYIPLEWYEDVINKLTRITILKCRTINDLNNLTNILKQKNEFQKLIKLVYTLKSNKLSINSDDWLSLDDHSEQFTDICHKVIEELLKVQKFDEAEELADYCELRKDRIHLARIARQIELLRINNDFEEILEFWKSSHVQLLKIGIKDIDFIDFLKFQNSRSNLTIEKIVLLNLICQLCPNDGETSKNLWQLLLQFVLDYKKKNELSNLREIFKKMLLFGKLNADPIKELINSITLDNQIIDFNNLTNNLNDQNIDALNVLLNNLIDIGKLSQAYVIAKYFRYFNQDLRTILNMLYVCLDMLKPDELDYTIQSFDTASFKGIKLTNVLRSLSRISDSVELIKDRIDCLEKLVYLSNHGARYCQQIKLDFRLANELLKIDYRKLRNEKKFDLLKVILTTANKNKYELAKDFVSIYELDQEELSVFLIDQIVPNIKLYVSHKENNLANSKQIIFNPANSEEFSRLIKMFNNPSLFGMKLLEKTKAMLFDVKNSEDFMLLTELLIRSHDCFIQSCSMDGISNVLQVCKQCASKLEKAGEFNIMIRLLTGIGHFSEMTYIMDFLWNNHQFEMLFGKGIGKEDKLRLALLDYLKRYHPNDHETYTMVTLNFTMHREIAKMLEEAAYQQLKVLETKVIENTPEIITDLQSILQYFSDAAQSFLKEDCVKQAESCIKKARLIALQTNFLSSNRVIVNMNTAALAKFITTHHKFWESFIVSEAYEKKNDMSMWAMAIYNVFIINNNEKYLLDFKGHIQLNTNIIEEVANRYKSANDNTKLNNQSVINMKKLLKYCKDISVLYKLALQLEFKDVINDLQSRNYSSIINDLIANKKIT